MPLTRQRSIILVAYNNIYIITTAVIYYYILYEFRLASSSQPPSPPTTRYAMTAVVDIRVKGEFCGELVRRRRGEGWREGCFWRAFGEKAAIYIIIIWRTNEMRLLLPSSSDTHKRRRTKGTHNKYI